ncbi:hypothetical protein CEXT_613421 [Caerostris extrusa]|uniref:Uncharacterized protein n=1 Tax=Caerostris extrusa TaxID=172846 RepID=A0AAV4RC15_CAEEX|nr:hypothetical protein CEXT_613421 [Caerostris extrusa]
MYPHLEFKKVRTKSHNKVKAVYIIDLITTSSEFSKVCVGNVTQFTIKMTQFDPFRHIQSRRSYEKQMSEFINSFPNDMLDSGENSTNQNKLTPITCLDE